MDSLYEFGMFPVYRSSDTACARSSFIVKVMIFSILFGILSGPGAFPFRNLWIASSISSGVTVVEIWIVLVDCWSFLISVRSASPSPRKNLSARIWALFSLSCVASSCPFRLSADMCAVHVPVACLLHLDILQSPLLCGSSLFVVISFRNLLHDALLPHFSSFLSRFCRALIDCLRCVAGECR